jgi:hypothetical protein
MAWTHKHVRFQPTISANRKCCRTTFHTNGPTIGANSPQTTARTHTPCKRTTPERGAQERLSHFRLFEGQSQEATPCITRPPGVSVWGDASSFLGQLPTDGDFGQAGSVRSPWPCTRSFTRARGLNPLLSKGLGLFANNVVSEACLWAVCKQCGLICGYCGSDVPHVCSECGPTSAFVCGPASG